MKNLEPNKNLEEIECDKFDNKLQTMQNLKTHMRVNHMSQTQTADVVSDEKITQTCETIDSDQEGSKVYEQYSCFYCNKEIASEHHLLEHRVICHGATDTPSLFSFPVRLRPLLYKCVICGL